MKRQRRVRERANIDIDYIASNVEKTELWVYENQQRKFRQKEIS